MVRGQGACERKLLLPYTQSSVRIVAQIYAHPQGQQQSLCALFLEKKNQFSAAMVGRYTEETLLSQETLMVLQAKYAAVAGGEGLPGVLPSKVETDFVALMVQECVPLIESFVDDYGDEVRMFVVDKVHESFEQYPMLREFLSEAVEAFYNKQLRHVHESARLFKEMEEQVDTVNGMYGQIRAGYREEILQKAKEEEEEKEKKAEAAPKYLDGVDYDELSVEEQHVVDKMIDIAAYWKLAGAQMADSVVKLLRLKIFSEPAETSMFKEIRGTCQVGCLSNSVLCCCCCC